MELSPEQIICVAEVFKALWVMAPALMMQVTYWANVLPLSLDWFVEITWHTNDIFLTLHFLAEAVDVLSGETMELP